MACQRAMRLLEVDAGRIVVHLSSRRLVLLHLQVSVPEGTRARHNRVSKSDARDG